MSCNKIILFFAWTGMEEREKVRPSNCRERLKSPSNSDPRQRINYMILELPQFSYYLGTLKYCLVFCFRDPENSLRGKVAKLIEGSPFELGRVVDATGYCLFDAFLAQLEHPTINPTVASEFRALPSHQGTFYQSFTLLKHS